MLIRFKVNRLTALVVGLGTLFVIGNAGVLGQPSSHSASSTSTIRLAQHLKAIGVLFYGSWTCPACKRQLNLFGLNDIDAVPYVECHKPEQYPDQAQLCRNADLRVYPTWELSDGSRLEGVQSLENLRRWSGLN